MVHVVDVQGLFVTENIFVGTRPRRLATTPDDKELWVSAELSGEMYIIDTTTYEIIDIIGSGSIGQVYKIKCKKSNKYHVMKVKHPNIESQIILFENDL